MSSTSPEGLTPVAISPIPTVPQPLTPPNLPQFSQIRIPGRPAPPSVAPTPRLPRITIPQISGFGTLGTYVPTYLADNEIGELLWNRPAPPQPTSTNSLYRRIGCIGDGSCFFHAIAKGLSDFYKLSYKEYDQIDERTLQGFEQSVGNEVRFPNSLFNRPRGQDLNTVYTILPNMKPSFQGLLKQYRLLYARLFRQDFAKRIEEDPRMNDLIKRRLQGRIQSMEAEPETHEIVANSPNPDQTSLYLTKVQLIDELLSGNDVKPDFILLLSDYLNTDIYLLRDQDLIDPNTKNTPLYSGSSLHESILGPIDMRSIPGPNRTAMVIISHGDGHYEIVGRVDQTTTEQRVNRTIETRFTQDEPLIRRLFQMLSELRSRQ